MRRWIGCFFGLMLFGAVVWGTADEMRHASELRQWLTLGFWAVIAAVILNLYVEDAYKKGADDMDREWDTKFNGRLKEGVLLEDENQPIVGDV